MESLDKYNQNTCPFNDVNKKGRQTSIILILALVTYFGLFGYQFASGQSIVNLALQDSKPEFPEIKQTSLGLYVTAKEAYEKWKTDPEKIKILDVRTMEEYIFIGHPAMAWNIPLFFQSYEWDASKEKFPMKPNPDFLTKVKQIAETNDTILVTCRSGGRSAMAVNQLAAAGFKNVYNITDGIEGDLIDDPESVFNGQRLKNGWKNSSLPYTYSIDPKLMLILDVK